MHTIIAAAIATAAVAGATDEAPRSTGWRVEVRDVSSERAEYPLDPKAGRLVASFDVDQGGRPMRKGDDIPYVDPESVFLPKVKRPDGSTPVGTKTLHSGLTVSIDSNGIQPVLHVRDVDLVGFDQYMALHTYVTAPRTHEYVLDAPIPLAAGVNVVGGYTMRPRDGATTRFFTIAKL